MIFIQNLLDLLLEASPWLVLGLALGGAMKALIPTTFLQRHLKGQGLVAIIKAAILGAPLPLCSCGVIPAALGLRKAGASKPATTSFLVSTPETGIDSISITYALLGPFMAIVRPIAALISALVAGLLVAIYDPEKELDHKISMNHKKTDCCGHSCSSEETHDEATVSEYVSACCDTTDVDQTQFTKKSWLYSVMEGIRYAFTQLLDDIVTWLIIGLIFAALVKTYLPPDFIGQWGTGITAMLIMLLAGIPMYICATASTPVAAGLMMSGVSPGVALVLLLTGPATNISTLGIIRRELGKQTMWLYLLGVGATAITSGLLVDYIVGTWNINMDIQYHSHEESTLWLQWGALLFLTGIISLRWLNKR
jgi:uncharacterized membrane protein YraQ (UPF0718 family)